MNLLRGAIAAGVRNPVFANLLMICMLGGGYFAVRAMQRETYPEFSLDIISIEVAYPGASPEDVEQAVCVPLEEAIADVEGVHELTSAASEASAHVWFTVRSTARDTGEILQDVRNCVDRITTFPPEVEKPVVRESVMRSDVVSIALWGDASERALKRWAREVRDELRALPEISQVALFGVRAEEIIIEVSEQALRAYGLSFETVMAAVRLGSLDLPAGTLRTAGEELTLRIKGRLLRAVDYEELVVLRGPDDNPGKIVPFPGPIQDNLHPFARQYNRIAPVQMAFGYVLCIYRRSFGHEGAPQSLMHAPVHRDIENLLDVQPPRKDDHVCPFRIEMRTEMFLHRIIVQLIDGF